MTPPQPPQITPEQRTAALAKAGEARRIRAEIKELLKTGSLTIGEVFDRAQSEDYVAGLKVESLLESLPGMGKIGAKRLLESLEIAPNRRIRGLGDRQRKALLAALG
ncbi:MAG TPA: integration host factor, actinobacterial type [Acidimicrobiia bacterium]|nr:integration host factor, actinobacterial type [Acidimicrobiia bacterium]